MRSAVAAAVPEGASSLCCECSSTISTCGKSRAACSANASRARRRARSWARRTTGSPAARAAASRRSRASASRPVVPSTTARPRARPASACSSPSSGRVKSTRRRRPRPSRERLARASRSARRPRRRGSARRARRARGRRPPRGPPPTGVPGAAARAGEDDARSRDRLEQRRPRLRTAASKRSSSGPMPAAEKLLGRAQLGRERRDVARGVTASTRAATSSSERISLPLSTARAEPRHARRRRLERQQHAALDALLRALELVGREAAGARGRRSARARSRRTPPRSRRACRRRRRPGRARRSSTCSCRRCRPCRAARGSPGRAATRPRRRARGRAARARSGARRRAREPGRREADVVLLGVAREEELPARPADGRRRGARPASAAPSCRRSATSVAEGVVLDVAGRGDDDRCRRRSGSRGTPRRSTFVERAHGGGAADHGPAELVLAEHAARGEVVHEIGGVVLDHRDLLEHDLALRTRALVLEARARSHVAHHVERERQVLVEHADVDDGRVRGRERVQLGAELVEDAGDLDLVVALAALEQQVLDEVRDAGLGRPLVARADVDEDADRDRAHRLDLLGDDAEAVGKRCQLMHGPERTSAQGVRRRAASRRGPG